ncbi:DUF1028 domain-containing protein [Mesobacillus selenatarsenatis]|uniref:Putative peptidoglycan binding domain-containing protein n=1 Tax=Mesobacillus selenatarsenatis (strain DSM 18680 / JCM 14380 / FERM P-15431 / SF-1) TaxID=1321606 RepID=A0A0A8WYG3_MESS1|nr:DUF1028 domain-containing protein [Mesobacillus selenatarsenatis]GAM11984.1 hypothetical protein SAMD00020551_0103 [Mesobacillus selenatarsenatis SF-1]
MTFSIVGFDTQEKEWGIAVQSKFLGVGAVVPFAKAGVGAVATQSYANTAYGPQALELMAQGKSAKEAMELITKEDPDKEMRQVGLIDAEGNPATFTGTYCYDWAGGVTGKHFAAQGNILVDENTAKAMAETFESTEGSLAHRLLQALNAGQKAGGDSRGQQSAALLVVKEKGGYGGYNDRYIDLRVDDHPEPITELIRIYGLQQLYFAKSKPENVVAIEGDVKDTVVQYLKRLDYLKADPSDGEELHKALTSYIHTENFEEREQEKGKIDLEVLDFMKNQ